MLCIGRECLGRIKLQTHYIHINELPMQVKLAGESTLLDETIRFIQVDGGKIIDAHTQVDLANGVCLPGPIDEIRQHPAPDAQVPVSAQDAHPKFTSMLKALALARAEGQRPRCGRQGKERPIFPTLQVFQRV